MSSIPIQNVALAEFLQNEDRYTQENMDRLGRMHVQKAESLLKQRPFCFKPSTATKVAEGVVLNGEVLMSNADESDDEDEANWINDIGSEYAQILRVAVLVIQALVEETRSLETDMHSRDQQFKNFVKIHPVLNQEDRQVFKDTKTVHNYEEMKAEMLDFVKKKGSRAVTASVIFFGHGTEKGLCFHKDGDEVSLDTVTEDFQSFVKENRSALELPIKGELILSQCSAYLHSPANSPDFTVYHFTNERVEKTYVRENCDPLSHQMELESHVREKIREGKKMMPEINDGPATSIGGLTEDVDELEIESFDG